jgi:bacteriocin biosynthesis cyclodehydratase domain-containing protein
MIEQPRLKSFLTVFPITGNTWGLRGGADELWRITLTDERAVRTFTALLPHLNGSRSAEAILAVVEHEGVDRDAALALLQQLERSSLIEDAATPSVLAPAEVEEFGHQVAFFSRYGVHGGARYQKVLRDAGVAVVGDGRFASTVRRHLASAGFGEVVALGQEGPSRNGNGQGAPDGESRHTRFTHALLDRERVWPEGTAEPLPRAFVVPQEQDDPELLEAMDEFSKRRGIPWMLLRAVERNEGWIGPLFVPGETACYLSFEARLRANLSYFAEQQAFTTHLRSGGERAADGGALQAHLDLLASIAAAELVKLFTEVAVPHLAGRLLTVNLSTWETETHDVLRVPGIGGMSASRPTPFPWKSAAYAEASSDDDILARRA